jgi:Uma2 family endonuclease
MVKNMPLPAKKEENKFSYADYLTWPGNERWEIINGVAYNMSPSPTRKHQKISIKLASKLYNYFEDKTCEVYEAPFDVKFPEDEKDRNEEIFNVVQPDILVVCDLDKLEENCCKGAPSIIIEIISPSTASKDFIKKRDLYEKNRVNQYWILDPEEKEIFIFKLNDKGTYNKPEIYTRNYIIKVEGFEGLEIDAGLIFKDF